MGELEFDIATYRLCGSEPIPIQEGEGASWLVYRHGDGKMDVCPNVFPFRGHPDAVRYIGSFDLRQCFEVATKAASHAKVLVERWLQSHDAR